MTITFTQPVCNLRIRFDDLDGSQNEYLGSVSPAYNNLTDVIGDFFDPTGSSNQVNSNIDNARGWVVWDGPLTSISFNYIRPSAGCGLVIDSMAFGCCPSLTISLPEDTTICLQSGSSFTIVPTFSGTTMPVQYLWSDNSTESSLNVTNSGTYWVDISDCCSTQRDSIEVVVNSSLPDVELISLIDSCIYNGESIVLIPTFNNMGSVLWSDGTSEDQLTVFDSGNYTVYYSNTCGIDSASCDVILNYFPELNLPTTLDTCFETGAGFLYMANGSEGSYQWDSGSQTATEWISQEGIYSCNLTNQCGSVRDSMLVRRITDIDLNILKDSILDCQMQLSVSSLPIETNYNLEMISPSGDLVQMYMKESGWYTIHAFNGCSELWDSIYVNLQNEQTFYLPNSFTPNGDLHNEYFEFRGENTVVREIQVFNRWGEEVFSENGKFSGWDGTYQGENCPIGIYAVHVVYTDCFGIPTDFHGHLNLIR
jgi:gliding motility-associated-like protein